MVLEIVKYGNPVLRQKGRAVEKISAEIRELAEDMIETMRAANGVGLAAQQVGEALQLTVVDISESEDRPSTMSIGGQEQKLEDWMPLILLNPKLELSRESESGTEGCLSFPEITAEIVRASRVKTRARLLDGSEIEFESTGLLARALQHETDHLNGVLFIDRMNSATKSSLKNKLKRLQQQQG